MIPLEPVTLLAAIGGACGAALLMSRTAWRTKAPALLPDGRAALLYRDGSLADANAAGWDLLARLGVSERLDALVERLSAAYPSLPDWMERDEGAAEIAPGSGLGPSLGVERLADGFRFGLAEEPAPSAPWASGSRLSIDRRAFAALERELAALRDASAAMPAPMWLDPSSDRPGWRNAAAVRDGLGPDSFDPGELERLAPGAAPERMRARDGRWWSVGRGERGHLTALPADSAVAAESAARSYAMALVETFAHLPVGLAVFAPDGRLRTFNPALAEMTGLDPVTLALRPSLRALLDRMREAGLLAAPGGWEAWSARIDRVEAGSRDGTFLETWELTDGRSWRVSGRPHPGGALALLIEDATTEAELSRRFEAELEVGQAIADTVADAIAVFAAGGTLVTANAAYAALWGSDPRTSLADPDGAAALSTWRSAAGDDPAWDGIGRLLRGGGGAAWSRAVPGPHGPLLCSGTPISRGAVLVRFAPLGSGHAAGAAAPPDARGDGGPSL